jgi:hypothetical protein
VHQRRGGFADQRQPDQRPGDVEGDTVDVHERAAGQADETRTARTRNCHGAAGRADSPAPRRRREPARHPWRRAPASAAVRCRSGLTRTTSHARPHRSRPRITSADGSSCQRPSRGGPTSGTRGGCCARTRRTRAREPEHVARLVRGREAPAAEDVADRVDAVGDVVQDESRTAPPHSSPVRPASTDPPIATPSPKAQRETADRPQREAAVDEADHRVARAGPARSAPRPALSWRNSQPTCACSSPAARRPADAVVDVGAVRIARAGRRTRGACGGRRPTRSPALDRRRSQRGEIRDHRPRLEAAVGEQPWNPTVTPRPVST